MYKQMPLRAEKVPALERYWHMGGSKCSVCMWQGPSVYQVAPYERCLATGGVVSSTVVNS